MYNVIDNTEILLDPFERSAKRRKDQRRRINKSVTRAPFRYICNIEIDGEGMGTGTLIGPRTVLTAAHVIWGTDDKKIDPITKAVFVVPARNGSKEPLSFSSVFKIIEYPGYNQSKEATKDDLAILHLDDPLGEDIGYWAMSHKTWPNDPTGVSMGTGSLIYAPGSPKFKVNLAGYPADKPSGCTTFTCATQMWWSYNRVVLKQNGLLHYYNDTFYGHSGSPVWFRRSKWKGGRVLLAVHVALDDGIGKVANRGVFIDKRVRSFISKHLK